MAVPFPRQQRHDRDRDVVQSRSLVRQVLRDLHDEPRGQQVLESPVRHSPAVTAETLRAGYEVARLRVVFVAVMPGVSFRLVRGEPYATKPFDVPPSVQ